MKSKIGFLYVAASACLFATGGLLIKMNSWNAVTLNGVRCFFAFFVLAFYMKQVGHQFHFNKTVLGVAAVNFGMNLCFVIANRLTTAANSIVLQFTQPIFIILIMWAVMKKLPERRAIIACAVSFVGILCFFFDSLTFTGQLGNVVALLSGFLYALVFLSKKLPDQDYESSVLISFILSFTVSIPFLLQETDLLGMNLATALLLGLVQQGVATIFLAKGLAAVQPLTASLTSMIEPVLNPIIVAVVCHEMIGPLALVGAATVLLSATVYNVLTIMKPVEA